MGKKEIDFEEVLSFIEKLPFNKFKEVVYHYSIHSKANFKTELEDMITLNFQQRLQKLKINLVCPKCNSENIV